MQLPTTTHCVTPLRTPYRAPPLVGSVVSGLRCNLKEVVFTYQAAFIGAAVSTRTCLLWVTRFRSLSGLHIAAGVAIVRTAETAGRKNRGMPCWGRLCWLLLRVLRVFEDEDISLIFWGYWFERRNVPERVYGLMICWSGYGYSCLLEPETRRRRSGGWERRPLRKLYFLASRVHWVCSGDYRSHRTSKRISTGRLLGSFPPFIHAKNVVFVLQSGVNRHEGRSRDRGAEETGPDWAPQTIRTHFIRWSPRC